MGKKDKSFSSFADAAAALKKLAGAPARAARNLSQDRAPSDATPRTGFEDIEAALLAKAQSAQPAPTSRTKRQEFAVEHAKRGPSKLVAIVSDAVDPAKVRAGLLAKRPAEARPRPKPSPMPPEPKVAPREPVAPVVEAPAPPPKPPAPPHIAVAPPPPPPPAPPAPPSTKSLLARIRSVFGEAPPPIEPRPSRTLPWVRTAIMENVKRGAEIFAARPEPEEPGFIIGCDFGTSSIKLVVRQPYRAGNPVAARLAPHMLQSARHPYLWQSVLWFDSATDAFSLTPGKGVALEGFKAGILAGEGGKRILPDLQVTRNEAAAAFLAMQLAHCLGWYARSAPLGAGAATHFLSINIGIPVAANDDSRTFRDFRHIVSTAKCLIPHAASLTHDQVRRCYQASTHELPAGFALVPELTAAISGYANEPFARNGAHMLIDVGASTLDIVAFNLVDRERVAAFVAEVDLLGAAALDASRGEGFDDSLFRQACFQQFDQVFNHARHPNVAPRNFDPTLRRNDVQLIAVGGGCKTDVHKAVLNRVNQDLGTLMVLNPSPPARMTDKKCDASRLLLAYGLTSDLPEQLELRRPSEIPPLTQRAASNVAFVSKDDV